MTKQTRESLIEINTQLEKAEARLRLLAQANVYGLAPTARVELDVDFAVAEKKRDYWQRIYDVALSEFVNEQP